MIGVFCGERFVDIDAEAGSVAGIHVAGVEGVVMGKDFVGKRRVVHVLLDAEVVDGEAEMQCGRHGDRRKIGGAMEAGADVIELGEVRGLLCMGDAAAVDDGHADVVDPLAADQIVCIPDGVEDLAGSDWGGGVLADDLEAFLQLGGAGIFHPEEVVGLEGLAETRGLDRGETVMDVVEQVDVGAEFDAEPFE